MSKKMFLYWTTTVPGTMKENTDRLKTVKKGCKDC